MADSKKKREAEKIKDLAQEYRAKGYEVIIEPRKAELPGFMKPMNFSPDLIARSPNENLVFEVKTHETTSTLKQISRYADLVRAEPGWDFVFVLTNPREKSKDSRELGNLSLQSISELVRQSERLLSVGDQDEFAQASFLLAWSAMEGVLRFALENRYRARASLSVSSMIRDAVMYGILSEEQSEILGRSLNLRNRAAHGFAKPELNVSDVREVITLADAGSAELGPDE